MNLGWDTPGVDTSREGSIRTAAVRLLTMSVVLAVVGCSTDSTIQRPNDDLRLNQMQVIGSHNSFHVAAPPEEYALLEALNPAQAVERT